MPSIPGSPSNPAVTPYLFSVPYPSAAGTAGPVIPVGTFLSAGSQVRQGPDIGDYSDAWVEVINYSDSMLSLKWDQGAMEPFIPPGQIWSARIPVSAQNLITTIAFQTAAQFFTNEVLAVTFYTDHDVRSGYRPRLGPLVPSVPAAAIGPGTLPVGVLPSGIRSVRQHLVTTALTTVFTYTPTLTGVFILFGYLFLNNSVSGNVLTFRVNYTDPDAGAAANLNMWTINGTVSQAFNGVNSYGNGRYPLVSYMLPVSGGTALTITYQDPTNTPSDFITIFLEQVA